MGKTAQTIMKSNGKTCMTRLNCPVYAIAVSFKVGKRKMLNTNTSAAIKNFPSSILGTPQPSYR